MADIKVCDRCGKKLADERSKFKVVPVRYTLKVTLFKKPNYWRDENIVETEHDLCMDCTLDLSDWLKHESEAAKEVTE